MHPSLLSTFHHLREPIFFSKFINKSLCLKLKVFGSVALKSYSALSSSIKAHKIKLLLRIFSGSGVNKGALSGPKKGPQAVLDVNPQNIHHGVGKLPILYRVSHRPSI